MGNTSSDSQHHQLPWTSTNTTSPTNTIHDQTEQYGRGGSDTIPRSWDCVTRLDTVQWNNAAIITSFVILGLINIMVIVGNTLVIMAVFLSEKLRTVTNLFIVSLAVSDLMVGLAVLPFSTANEVLGVWIFGTIWCEVWLAVDVWMCTASILNLCVISLDRYLAVTRPISYPSIMSSKRAKILIALVWCLSFVICFPPLVGWNDSRQHNTKSDMRHNQPGNHVATRRSLLSHENIIIDRDSLDTDYYGENSASVNFSGDDILESAREIAIYISTLESNLSANVGNGNGSGDSIKSSYITEAAATDTPLNNSSVLCQCQLISDKGYRIYSAIGSFYLPMFVMMFFYWRIYRAAVETTRAINQGFRTTKSASGIGGRFDEQRLTLRIHRGRSATDLYAKSNGTSCEKNSAPSTNVSFKTSNRRVRNSSLRETTSRMDVVASEEGGMTFPPSGERKVRSLHVARHRTAGANSSSGQTSRFLNGPKRKAMRRPWTSSTLSSSANNNKPSTSSNSNNSSPSTTTTNLMQMSRHNGNSGSPNYQQSDTVSSTTVINSGSCSTTVTTTTIPLRDSTGVDDVGLSDLYDSDKRGGGGGTGGGGGGSGGPQVFSKMGKRNIKAQVKRFKMETKAAKTLGIIVGGFILCWLPFFTVYLIGAFCVNDCIPESLFAVIFWLGYCNSAINPCVYALFSRDFRNAFKRILCRCFMRKENSVKERIVNMFPATFHLASFFEESEDNSNSH